MSDQISLPETTKRELALERAQKMSRALHDAARKARLTVRGNAVWQPGAYRSSRRSRMFVLLSALVVVVLPTLAGAIYFGLIASDQYQVEVQFAVKPRELDPTDAIARLTGIPSLQVAQDSLVIVDYMKSRAMVEKLQERLDLRAMYQRPGTDWFSRLPADASIEDFVKYWRERISVVIDASGIVSLHVRAFTPEDAFQISKAVIAVSEELVNETTMRTRQDSLSQAQDQVRAAEKRLVEVRRAVRTVRDREQLIDPVTTTKAVTELLNDLKLDQLKLQNEIQVSSRSLSKDAPQMRVLRAKLDATSDQIRTIERSLTSADDKGGPKSLSGAYSDFDKAKLEQTFAEKFYTTVSTALEKARIEADRQQMYLNAFVEPVLPEKAMFPRRAWNTLLVAGGALFAWLLINYIRSTFVH